MFRKTILSAFTIAILGTTAAAFGTTAASAGGYGYGGNDYGNGGYNSGYNGGYQQPHRNGNNWQKHVDWCFNRYNSYNAHSNTYRPYSGPRKPCYSPYYKG